MAYTYYKKILFDPESMLSFSLSRTKLELFLECPRCFYLDRRIGVSRPSIPSFTLNSAVDTLLKKEFDIHRAKNQAHPLMKAYNIDAIPFSHDKLNEWRHNFTGVRFYHKPTNLVIFGAIDDLWINTKGELHVVDYKATSTQEEIKLDSEYRQAYKRQMEIYQWLLRQNQLPVSDMGYFVYCNGSVDKEAFDGKLEFDIQIIPYKGNDTWVEETVFNAKKCLTLKRPPKPSDNCQYCRYTKSVTSATS